MGICFAGQSCVTERKCDFLPEVLPNWFV